MKIFFTLIVFLSFFSLSGQEKIKTKKNKSSISSQKSTTPTIEKKIKNSSGNQVGKQLKSQSFSEIMESERQKKKLTEIEKVGN